MPRKAVALMILILTPALTAAWCNLGVFTARLRQSFYTSEDYEQGIKDLIVEDLFISPLPTLTPTPLPSLTPTPTP
ncbi:MAG: hypothetical protein D6784_15700, partial [Chloroflexi bacterium]